MVEIFNKYGLKGTFNVNSGYLGVINESYELGKSRFTGKEDIFYCTNKEALL